MAIVCAGRDSNTASRLLLFGEINRIHRRLLRDCFSGGPFRKIHLVFLPAASLRPLWPSLGEKGNNGQVISCAYGHFNVRIEGNTLGLPVARGR